jgi:hypothetical protein
LAKNEEGLRSLEMVWLFDGLAMEDMIGEVRERRRRRRKKKLGGMHEREVGREGKAR